jgi:hypothetical protein
MTPSLRTASRGSGETDHLGHLGSLGSSRAACIPSQIWALDAGIRGFSKTGPMARLHVTVS